MVYLPQAFAASSSASSAASSSSSGGVKISGSCGGSCTVHAGATATHNGKGVHRDHTLGGPGSFSNHAPTP
jgi:hypothetical protein